MESRLEENEMKGGDARSVSISGICGLCSHTLDAYSLFLKPSREEEDYLRVGKRNGL